MKPCCKTFYKFHCFKFPTTLELLCRSSCKLQLCFVSIVAGNLTAKYNKTVILILPDRILQFPLCWKGQLLRRLPKFLLLLRLKTRSHCAHDSGELRECEKSTIHWFGIWSFGCFLLGNAFLQLALV